MTEEQNKLADELDAEVKNERSGKIANLMMRASAALREREPATEAVLPGMFGELGRAVSYIEDILLAPTDALRSEAIQFVSDMRVKYKQPVELRALKGKGASQGATERTGYHWWCPKCQREVDWRDDTNEVSIGMAEGQGLHIPCKTKLELRKGSSMLPVKAAPEPSGEFVRVRKDVVEFLRGAAPLDGFWFGEKPLGLRAFWWRKYFFPDEQKG